MIKAKNTLEGKLNVSVVKEYPELENIEVMPTTEEQVLKSNKYGFDEVKIHGVTAEIDENIKSEYIKEGVNILGIDGGYKGIDTSDATATSDDILSGKTAYVNNELIEGTIEEYDGSFEGNVGSGVKITDASYLFYRNRRLDYLYELLGLCENVTNTVFMFDSCNNLTELELSNLDTSNVTEMQYMFNNCTTLIKLNISNFNTSKVTNMEYMFYNCSKLTELDLSNFDTSNVVNMKHMFNNCTALKKLNISNFNTSKVTNMEDMFTNIYWLTELDLSNFDTSNVTSMSNMFNNCRSLEYIPVLDASKCKNVYKTFNVTQKLINFGGFKNLGKGYSQKANNYTYYKLDLSANTQLTHESLMNVINNLYDLNLTYDVANGGTLYTQGLVLGATNLAKLTAEEIAIATNKGWTVS